MNSTPLTNQIKDVEQFKAYTDYLSNQIFDALSLTPNKRKRNNLAKELLANINNATYAVDDERTYTPEFLQTIAINLTTDALAFFKLVEQDIKAIEQTDSNKGQ